VTAHTAARSALTAAVLVLLAGCTAAPKAVASAQPVHHGPAADTGALRLAAAGSCTELMADVRAAARPLVGSWGVPGRGPMNDAAGPAMPVPAAPGGAAKADGTGGDNTPNYSGTNTAEPGADEPDLVKTDGRRIVTVNGSVLRVVDARTRQVTGRLDLSGDGQPTSLLLAGDRALVLLPWGNSDGISGPRLLLVDLSGETPAVVSGYVIDGALVDARQVGNVVRVVVRSGPRLPTPVPGGDPLAAAQAAVDRAGPDEWLPRYAVTADGRTRTGRVDCGRVRLPERYSGTAMLSLLTFDLSRPGLSDGDPVTILADGQTVYANGTSLYVVNGNQWMEWPTSGIAGPSRPFRHETQVYQFDIADPGTPAYVAAGTVPGWVLNQYALSEWKGNLRVATTFDGASSSVTVLGRDGGLLRPVGTVGGLGKGQRIYAVRFAGPVGYVVTFRQTDPLYTVDLRDPTRPAVTGALEIDGYSAYLHPAGDGRLIGVGQASTSQGRNLGVQVSLFDVSDPTRPARLARYDLPGSGHSTAEFDPHAFLFWPATGLMVVPIRAGALALRVTGNALQKAGDLDPKGGALLRSLVVGTTLWTVTTGGLAAADLGSLTEQAWLPY
jgi:hypothetical protein